MRFPTAAGINIVATLNGIIFPLSSLLRAPYFSTRKKAGRVLQVTTILGFQTPKKIRGPPYPPHYAIFGQKRAVF